MLAVEGVFLFIPVIYVYLWKDPFLCFCIGCEKTVARWLWLRKRYNQHLEGTEGTTQNGVRRMKRGVREGFFVMKKMKLGVLGGFRGPRFASTWPLLMD